MVLSELTLSAAAPAAGGVLLALVVGWWLGRRRPRAALAASRPSWEDERLRQYQALLQKSLAGVYLIQNEVVVYANPRFAEIIGYPEAEVPGLTMNILAADAANRALVAGNLRRRESGEVESLHYVLQVRRRDDRVIDLEVFGTRTEYQGRPAVIGTALDITGRRQAEEALRQSEQRTSLILDNASDVMGLFAVEAGPTLRLVSLNRRLVEAARTAGSAATAEDLIGRTLDELISQHFRLDPSSIAQAVDRYREVVATGRKTRFEETRDLPAGLYHAETVLSPVLGRDGRCAFVLYSSTDITERRLATAALARSEESHRALFEEASDPIAVIGEDGRIAEANPRLCQWLGYARDELIHRIAQELLAPEESAAFEQRRARLRAGPLPPREYQFRHRDGAYLRAEANAKRLPDGRTLAILRDTTERRRNEETRRQLESQLQQAQKLQAIGTLAGGIAHDFNNILTAILGNAELLRMVLPENSRGREHADEILDASRRARDLVRQILAFSRRQDQERREYSLQTILAEVLRMVRVTLPRNIEIRTELNDEEPIVSIDATQMHQVIVNLCTNAAHAMRASGGLITIAESIGELPNAVALAHPQLRSGRYVCLSVRDTGHGMDAATLQRIFEPFFTTKGPGEGTGLGLAVVHGIIGAHEGAITVESAPGEGTCFRIYLPASTKSAERPASAVPAGVEAASGQERLLFVDDDESVRLVGKPILERLGYRVTAFPTGNDALEFLRLHPQEVDVIVSDFSMPGLDGIELAQAAWALRPGLPFVLLSGYGDTHEAAGAGIRYILAKPFSMSALSATVREALTTPT